MVLYRHEVLARRGAPDSFHAKVQAEIEASLDKFQSHGARQSRAQNWGQLERELLENRLGISSHADDMREKAQIALRHSRG